MTDPVQTDRNRNISPFPHAVESWSMEKDAEHLMNDLFANVDVLLEGSESHLPNQLAHLQTEQLPSVQVAATAVTSESPVIVKPRRTIRMRTRTSTSPQAVSNRSRLTWQTQLRAWRTRLWVHLDKVCFGVACLSLGSAIVWFVHQNRPSFPTKTNSDSSVSEAEFVALSPEDAQFAQYMLRSLRVIERQLPQTPVVGQRVPQITASSDRAQADVATSPQVIERIYIPVYPPSRAPATQSPSKEDSTAPSESSVSPSLLPQVPTPEQLTRRSETTIPSFETDSVNEPAFEETLPTGNHKVVGIIQAGDRTTVLVKEGEATHRVEPGEEVGNSGWMLVSADAGSQIATIRRNGDVRSITNGQSF